MRKGKEGKKQNALRPPYSTFLLASSYSSSNVRAHSNKRAVVAEDSVNIAVRLSPDYIWHLSSLDFDVSVGAWTTTNVAAVDFIARLTSHRHEAFAD